MTENNNNRTLSVALFVLYLVFLVSLIFAFRAISTISMGLILVVSVVKNMMEHKPLFSRNLNNLFVLSCLLFFCLQLVSLLYAHNLVRGWNNIRLESALVLIPLSLCCGTYLDERSRRKLLKWYSLFLFLACLFAIYHAWSRYSVAHDSSVFLYHSLVSIYSGHAVQYSILVFAAILHLFEMLKAGHAFISRPLHFFLLTFFFVFLLLLSSKLVIVVSLVYLIYATIRFVQVRPVRRVFAAILIIGFTALCTLTFLTTNPVSDRFKDILPTDLSYLHKEKFNPGEYFNGLEFRVLQWKFVPAILTRKNAWLFGVSAGDARDNLDSLYASKDMYLGTPSRGDTGFIGYNAHNQLLESLLETGITGALLFLLICFAMLRMAVQRRNTELSFMTILLLAYSFSEAVLQSQYSLFIFIFFPLFFYLPGKVKS